MLGMKGASEKGSVDERMADPVGRLRADALDDGFDLPGELETIKADSNRDINAGTRIGTGRHLGREQGILHAGLLQAISIP